MVSIPNKPLVKSHLRFSAVYVRESKKGSNSIPKEEYRKPCYMTEALGKQFHFHLAPQNVSPAAF
jgi:hypothetical protein